jgi:hypothetical protein
MFEVAAAILGAVAVVTGNPFILLFGLGALITALILLIIWMAACRDCATLSVVMRVVAGFLLLFVTIAIILAYFNGPLATNTLAVVAVVVTLLVFLGVAEIGRRQLGCP